MMAAMETKRGGQIWPPLEHGDKKSVLEGGATDELAHNGGRWNFLIADGDEVMDELQETVGFAVFGAVLGHRSEDGLGMVA